METAVKNLRDSKPIYVMGDFNNPADVRCEGYDLITNAGWQGNDVPLRIDYIFSSLPQVAAKYEIKFDGNKQPCVSDYYGVFVSD